MARPAHKVHCWLCLCAMLKAPSDRQTTMPRALRTLRLSFCETHLTHFGGMVLLQRNADYHPSDLILALLYAVMAGLRRINQTEILQYNVPSCPGWASRGSPT